MHILFLSRWYPFPADNGSKLRILALLKGLAEHHAITLISFYNHENGYPDLDSLRTVCQQIFPVAYKGFEPSSTTALLGFLRPTPRSVLDTYSVEVEQLIRKELANTHYDMVIASQFDMAIYATQFQHIPSLFEEVEVGTYYDRYQQAESPSKQLRNGMTWWKHSRYLASLIESFSVCTVVSREEKELLQRINQKYEDIVIIPNCVNLEDYNKMQVEPEPNTLIFTGSFHYHPNYEAMCWFISEVFPKILEKIPQAKLVITGDHGNKPIPDTTGVSLVGYVSDIRRLVASSWISIAPIFSGGGTRLKILEAMALRTPVVATPKGAEGLDFQPGVDLLTANTPAEFAESCIKLLKSSALRSTLSKHAFQRLEENYSWGAVMPKFLDLVQKAGNKTELLVQPE